MNNLLQLDLTSATFQPDLILKSSSSLTLDDCTHKFLLGVNISAESHSVAGYSGTIALPSLPPLITVRARSREG